MRQRRGQEKGKSVKGKGSNGTKGNLKGTGIGGYEMGYGEGKSLKAKGKSSNARAKGNSSKAKDKSVGCESPYDKARKHTARYEGVSLSGRDPIERVGTSRLGHLVEYVSSESEQSD